MTAPVASAMFHVRQRTRHEGDPGALIVTLSAVYRRPPGKDDPVQSVNTASGDISLDLKDRDTAARFPLGAIIRVEFHPED